MIIAQTYHDYIEADGEQNGLCNFLSAMDFMIQTGMQSIEDFNDFCDAMIEEKPFPNCLTWCEIKREMNENINQSIISQ